MRIWVFLLGIVLFVAACFGLILFSPALANTFSDRVSFRDITWSPDGNKVAFLADIHTDTTSDFFYTLYVVDADGKHLKKVTGGGIDENINSFAWSPDGNLLAVVEAIDKEISIYDLNGNEVQKFDEPNDRFITALAWSFDSKQLAVMTSNSNYSMIYLVGIDSDNVTEIHGDGQLQYDSDLAWSPDGEKLVIRLASTIKIISLKPQPVSEVRVIIPNYIAGTDDLSWSEDSQKVIFTSAEGVYEVEANGGEIEKIGDAPEYQAGVMSPEGELQAKVGCGDENQADESNIDIFPCNFYEIHIMRDAEVVAKVGIEDLKAIGGGSGLTWRGFTILLVVVFLIAPAMTLPYAILHHHWVSKLFVVLVMTFYLLVCGIVLVDVLVL